MVGKGAGWLGERTQTVVVSAPASEGAASQPVVAAKPIVGNGFQPAQIYRSRSSGVVTIYSFFGDPHSATASAGQGSGFVVSKGGSSSRAPT